MKQRIQWIMAAILIGSMSLTSCVDENDNPVTPEQPELPYSDAAWMDTSVNPGDNFYMYVLGSWDKNHAMDDLGFLQNQHEKANASLYDDFVNSSNPLAQHLVRNILRENPKVEDDVKDVLDYLQIQKPTSLGMLLQEIGKLQDKGLNPLFSKEVDGHEETHSVKEMVSGGELLSLTRELLAAGQDEFMRSRIQGVLIIIDKVTAPEIMEAPDYSDKLRERVNAIYNLESTIFKATMAAAGDTQVAASGIHKGYELRKLPEYIEAKNIARTRGVRGAAVKDEISIESLTAAFNLGENSIIDNSDVFKEYMVAIDNLLKASGNLDCGYDYLRYFAVMSVYNFIKSNYPEFFDKEQVAQSIYELLAEKFPLLMNKLSYDFLKKKSENQVDDCRAYMEELRALFRERLEKLDWLSDATRQAALRKLEAMKFNIGMPDRYSEGEFILDDKNSLVQDALSIIQQDMEIKEKYLCGKLIEDLPLNLVAYYAWYGDVNASYSCFDNALTVMPMYITEDMYPKNDEHTRLMVSWIFGHEITHGFDSKGAKYDEKGYLKNWWTAEDAAKFKEKQDKMVALFNRLEAFPGQSANGLFTLDENMADYGGLTLGYELFKRKKQQEGLSGKAFDRACQEFFLDYTKNWRTAYDLESLQIQYETDEHSNNINRVNGIVTLFDDWYRLFNVTGGKIYVAPENRVKIW